MAVGDLLVADYQYEFRGFLWGAGTAYVNESADGLLSMADVSGGDLDIEGDHGSVPGLAVLRKKIVTCKIKPDFSPATTEAMIALLQSTFQLPRRRYVANLEQLAFRRNGIKKFLWVRCDKRDIPSDYKTAMGSPDVVVQFTAPDPIIYGLVLKTQNIVVASGATTNSGVVVNAGDFRDGYLPKITINGPATNPRIQSTEDDARQLKITNVLTAGQSIVVDFATKTVSKGGVVDHDLLANDSQWFAILPGNNTLTVNRDVGNTGASSTITVEWRDTYS
jgi:hypothetical protein